MTKLRARGLLLIVISSTVTLMSACGDSPATAPLAPVISGPLATSSVVEVIATDLGVLTVGGQSAAFGINDAGQAVGDATGADGWPRPVLFRNGIVTELPMPSGSNYGSATDLNNEGQAVGYSVTFGVGIRPLLWDMTASPITFRDLGMPDGSNAAFAFAINDAGLVVGGFRDPITFNNWPVSWQVAPVINMSPLPTPPGNGFGFAQGVNDAGRIVGSASGKALIWHAGLIEHDLGEGAAVAISNDGKVVAFDISSSIFIWDDGTFGRISGLGYARGINSAGQISGGFQAQPVVWQNTGTVTLPGLPLGGGEGYGDAYGINDAGQVVGRTYLENDARAVLWTFVAFTPAAILDGIVATVEALVISSGIDKALGGALLSKMHAATRLLDQGKTEAVTGQLQAFINQVESLMKSGQLSPENGEALIDAARGVIAQIQD